MKNSAHAADRAVKGRFSRKIHRQEFSPLEERAPPTTGPIPLANAVTAPYKTAGKGQLAEGFFTEKGISEAWQSEHMAWVGNIVGRIIGE